MYVCFKSSDSAGAGARVRVCAINCDVIIIITIIKGERIQIVVVNCVMLGGAAERYLIVVRWRTEHYCI